MKTKEHLLMLIKDNGTCKEGRYRCLEISSGDRSVCAICDINGHGINDDAEQIRYTAALSQYIERFGFDEDIFELLL